MQVTVEIFDDETEKVLKSIKENTSDCEIISVRPANGQKPNGTSGPYYLVKPSFDPDFMLLRICLSFASFCRKFLLNVLKKRICRRPVYLNCAPFS